MGIVELTQVKKAREDVLRMDGSMTIIDTEAVSTMAEVDAYYESLIREIEEMEELVSGLAD